MWHQIAIEIDADVAKRIKTLLQTKVPKTEDTIDMCRAIQESLNNDDAEDE